MTAPTKRKATPRKAVAKAKVNGDGNGNGSANGHPLPPAEAFTPTEPVVEQPAHPYGDKQTYTFNPTDGGPIIFPHISEVNADAHFFWKIYQMNEMFQAFEWMNKAGVPLPVQERVMLLPDAEKQRFFSGWFSAVTTPQGVAPPGES